MNYQLVDRFMLVLLVLSLVACNTIKEGTLKYTLIVDQKKKSSYYLELLYENKSCQLSPVSSSAKQYPALSRVLSAKKFQQLNIIYINSILKTLHKKWIRPPILTPFSRCLIRIKQCLNGDIINAVVLKCSDLEIKNSIESMFKKIKSIPLAPNRAVWSPEFEIEFKPN